LDLLVLAEVTLELLLTAANAAYFYRYSRRSLLQSRRVAALVALISAGLGTEALIFLLVSLGRGSLDALLAAGPLLFVRGLLLASAGFVSFIVWRGRSRA
jgi:hypothetical protein